MNPYHLSFWEKTAFFDQVDVLIIGSGIVGLSAAISIVEKEPNRRVLVLERGPLPIGASTRNAGFACFGSVTELLSDYLAHGPDAVWNLVEQRWKGLERLRNRLGDTAIQYEPLGGYELFRSSEEALFESCMAYLPEFNKALKSILGVGNYFSAVDAQIKTFGFQGVGHLLLNAAEGQIHTGKMMKALLQYTRSLNIDILNGLEVEKMDYEEDRVQLYLSSGWSIKAKKVIIATNGFARQLLPELEVQPARNQVLITHPIPGLKIKGCFHYDQGYYYFRNIADRLLLGGGRNIALQEEYTDQFGTSQKIKANLEHLLDTLILPKTAYKIDRWWSGILGVGEQKAPIVRYINPSVVVAVRLGGMGVALGSLVGESAAELIIDS